MAVFKSFNNNMSVKSSIKAEFSEDLHDKEAKEKRFQSQLTDTYERWTAVHTCDANTTTGARLKRKRKGDKMRRGSLALSPKWGQRRPNQDSLSGVCTLRAVFKWLSKDCDCYAWWLAKTSRANERQNPHQSHLIWNIFPAFWESYRWSPEILIGLSLCLLLLRSVRVIGIGFKTAQIRS